jgi:hydrogenase small subunit
MTVTRREFLKTTAALGATSVFALYSGDIAEVFSAATADDIHVIWFQGAADSGCSISLIQGTHPDLIDAITDFKLSVDFHPNIMIPEGDAAVGVLSDTANGSKPLDVFVLEGSVPDGNFGTVGEIDGKPVPMETWVRQLASQAKYVVAVGTCATWGGVPGAFPNPTNAKGLQFYKNQKGGALGADFKSKAGLPVVNIPGCPPHPDWITLTLADVLQGFVPDLDSYNRPTAFFGRTVHDQCPRLGYYQKGEFSQGFGELRCLWKLGCKGPITYANCPLIKWNNGTNSCTIFGSGCRGCVDPAYPDAPLSPFFKEIEAVPAPLGIDAVTAGTAALGVTAVAIAAHAIRRGPLKHRRVESETAPETKAGGA